MQEIKAGTTQVPNLLKLDFDYGTTHDNGNLLSQTILRTTNLGAQTWTQNYGYTDGLNRLNSTVESGAGSWSLGWGYDPWANGWVSSFATMTPSTFTPQLPTNFNVSNQLQMQGAAYDGAGNHGDRELRDAVRRREPDDVELDGARTQGMPTMEMANAFRNRTIPGPRRLFTMRRGDLRRSIRRRRRQRHARDASLRWISLAAPVW